MNAPQLVIFDVDGTLHDVERWWPQLIHDGVAAFAQDTGLDLQVPGRDEAMSVVGNAGEAVWKPFLPADLQDRWADLRAKVLPMEVDVLRSPKDYLFDGVRELLQHLRSHGIATALASNCGADYMAAMKVGQGLGELTDQQFCLASPGVDTKADMLCLAMQGAGIDKAHTVMVGDRRSDLEAAVAAEVPFVWRANAYSDLSDTEASLRWDGDPDQLLGLLQLPRIS